MWTAQDQPGSAQGWAVASEDSAGHEAEKAPKSSAGRQQVRLSHSCTESLLQQTSSRYTSVLQKTTETPKASIYKPEIDWSGGLGKHRPVLLVGPLSLVTLYLRAGDPARSTCIPRLAGKREVNTLKGGTVYSCSENFCR